MSTLGPLTIEAKSLGGSRFVADLSTLFASWSANDVLNSPGQFIGNVQGGTECADVLSKLEPWWTEIEIRDPYTTQVLWAGVITESPEVMSPDTDTAMVTAYTMPWWLQARAVHTDVSHLDGVAAPQFAYEVAQACFDIADPGLFDHLVVHTTGAVDVNRKVGAYAAIGYDAISELLGATVDMWCRGRAIHFGPAGYRYGHLGAFGMSVIGGPWSTVRRGGLGATKTYVRNEQGIIVGEYGGPVASPDDPAVQVLIEDISYLSNTDEASANAIAAGRVMSRAPLEFVNDAASGWIDCSSGIEPTNLSVAVGVTLEVPTASGVDTRTIDARITALTWSYDGAEWRVGARVADRSAGVL